MPARSLHEANSNPNHQDHLSLALLKTKGLSRPESHTHIATIYQRLFLQKNHHQKNLRREFPQLMPHHILRDRDLVVDLAVVDLEAQSHEIRQDGGRARLRSDRRCLLTGFEAWDRKAEEGVSCW